jgi:predicted amidohydrolase
VQSPPNERNIHLVNTRRYRALIYLALLSLFSHSASTRAADFPATNLVRIAALQPKTRLIDWRLTNVTEVLARVDTSLSELENLIELAAAQKCRAIALPEDTLGLGTWLAGNEKLIPEVLPVAVDRMLKRFSALAAKHQAYIVSCNDNVLPDGKLYNMSFLIGPEGKQIGQYKKVCPTVHEGARSRGSEFPVFSTPDLGGIGMLICYDMVFPETARALTLNGADVIFHLTLGGAAIGDGDISLAAFRTRAVENFVYIVVSQRGTGSMIISPKGKIIAEAKGPDSMVIADIDPFGGRDGGDAMNQQRDMRARLFRERNPAAFQILTDTNPPILAKVPESIPAAEVRRIADKVLTVGDQEFKAADSLFRASKTNEARAAYEKLRQEYRGSWIDRVSTERLAKLGPSEPEHSKQTASGLASKYPNDRGIENDPAVLFADNFESGDMSKWDQKRGPVTITQDAPNSGNWSVEMPMHRGKNHGSDAIKWFMPGADTVYARFYVKFSSDYSYSHHFVWLSANQRTNKWSSFGKAGLKPNGTYYSTAMEPWFAWGKNPPPGEVNLYTYYLDMERDPKMDKYWGNGFFPPGPGKGTNAGPSRYIPPLNEWHCWEFMLQANTAPDKADGRQAMWVDGKLIAEFTNIRWRTDMDLKVNSFWLEHYGYDPGDPTKQYWKDSQSVWFDDVVVAREYIGPIKR